MRFAGPLLLAAIVFFTIRWLEHYSERRDSGNAGGLTYRAHDSTHAAYERRSKELMEEREAEIQSPPAVTKAKEAEAQRPIPQTRVGEGS